MGHFQDIFHQAHRGKSKEATTTGKVGYTATVQNIFVVTPPPPEYHHRDIDNLNTIVQGMQMQSYDLEGLA